MAEKLRAINPSGFGHKTLITQSDSSRVWFDVELTFDKRRITSSANQSEWRL